MTEFNVGKIEGAIDYLIKHFEMIDKTIYGNGQPGLEQRETQMESEVKHIKEAMSQMTNIVEQQQKSTTELLEKQSELIERQEKIVNDLADLLRKHIEDKESHKRTSLKDLVWNKTFPLYVIGVFVFLHGILGNATLEQLGKAILKIFGVDL